MPATFTVDAYPTERFRGTVRQIRNAPTTVQNVVTYDAVIDVDNTELKLKPGMTANVTFVYAEKKDVLRVPNAALRFKPPPEMLGSARDGAAARRRVRRPSAAAGGAPASGERGHAGGAGRASHARRRRAERSAAGLGAARRAAGAAHAGQRQGRRLRRHASARSSRATSRKATR